jgi:hypothetical protein
MAYRTNLQILDELGRFLANPAPTRARLLAEMKAAQHMTSEIIRDRLALYNVAKIDIESIVSEFEEK